jgi:two-component system cell cycle sensor histidine kinase/response regulator CckA
VTENGTILVVDDDAESLRLAAGVLSSEGYRVRPADSGELALASVAAKTPELALLDVRMPGLDGFTVCRRLKEFPETRNIPVLFLSAAGDADAHVEGLRLGAVDFISKPLHREELLARVRTHIELVRLRKAFVAQAAGLTADLRSANELLRSELAERRNSEHALHESQHDFWLLAKRAPVGIWLLGPDRLATFYNRNAVAFVGRKPDPLTKDSWTSIVHPADLEDVRSRYLSAVLARRRFRIECRMRCSNGEYRWVLNTGIPRFVKGVFCGYIGASIDITELKRNHERIVASRKTEGLATLAAGIAHDFNNLLGSIFAESDLALSDIPPDSPARDSIERISTVAVRASEIVDLLVSYAGDRGVTFENVDLSKTVAEMLQLLKTSISPKANVHVQLARDLPPVWGNAAQIRQVVMNLITNASESLPNREGVITIATRRVQIGRASSAEAQVEEGDYAQLVVSDTGCGMAPEVRDRVFDPFYSTKLIGRGLGLAVVQGILRSHGGSIDVVSTAGIGSNFEVLLPLRARIPSAAVQRGREASLPARTILVIEDEDKLRLAVSRALRRNGFEVLAAADADLALELFRTRPVDAIVLDLTLPTMCDVLPHVKQINPEARIVVTAAHDLDAGLESGFAAQELPSAVVRKPYRLSELLQAVQSVLPRRPPAVASALAPAVHTTVAEAPAGAEHLTTA